MKIFFHCNKKSGLRDEYSIPEKSCHNSLLKGAKIYFLFISQNNQPTMMRYLTKCFKQNVFSFKLATTFLLHIFSPSFTGAKIKTPKMALFYWKKKKKTIFTIISWKLHSSITFWKKVSHFARFCELLLARVKTCMKQ